MTRLCFILVLLALASNAVVRGKRTATGKFVLDCTTDLSDSATLLCAGANFGISMRPQPSNAVNPTCTIRSGDVVKQGKVENKRKIETKVPKSPKRQKQKFDGKLLFILLVWWRKILPGNSQ